MAEAASRSRWQIASAQMALLANVNRTSKQRPFTPDDFNPYARPHKQKADISVLKALLPHGR